MAISFEEAMERRKFLRMIVVDFLPDLSVEYLCKTCDEAEAKRLAYEVYLENNVMEGYESFGDFERSSEIDRVDMFLLSALINRSVADCESEKVITLQNLDFVVEEDEDEDE